MTAITMHCPSCKATLNIDPKYAGVTGTCRSCQSPVHVPNPATSRPIRVAQACAILVAVVHGILYIVAPDSIPFQFFLFIIAAACMAWPNTRRIAIAYCLVMVSFWGMGTLITCILLMSFHPIILFVPFWAAMGAVFYRASKTAKHLSKQP